MFRTRHSIVLVLSALVVAASVARSSASPEASRIVSIGGSVTEIVYALGFGDRVVGVDTTSVFPPEALHTAASVGYMRALSAEGVLSLNPSIILAIDGSGPPAALKLLADAQAPVVMVADEATPDAAARKIETIGARLGEPEKAKALATRVRARFASLDAMRPRTKNPPRVLFLLSLQNGRAMAAGAGTGADAAIRLAGGTNAAADFQGYKPITDEGVIAAAPDVVLKMTNGALVGPASELFALPAFAATPAAKTQALIGMDGPYLLGFGPREPDALHDLMSKLYPQETFPPLIDETMR